MKVVDALSALDNGTLLLLQLGRSFKDCVSDRNLLRNWWFEL